MAVFISRERWRRQPNRPMQINEAHPLVDLCDLRFFVAFFAGVPFEFVTGTIGAPVSGPAVVGGAIPVGGGLVGRMTSAAGSYYEFPHRAGWEILSAITLAWRGQLASGSNYRHFAGKHSSSGGSFNPYDFRTDNSASPKPTIVRATGGASTGNYEATTALSVGVASTVEVTQGALVSDVPSFYVNGTLTGTTTLSGGSASPPAGTQDPLRIGRRTDGAVQMDGVTEYVLGFASILSAEALRELRRAPYAMLRPRETPVFYSLGSGTSLTVADATHGHQSDAVALTQAHQLAAADATHAQTVDTLNLTQVHALVAQDATHGHQTDALTLTQAHLIAVADALHAHAADHLNLSGVATLAISDALHAHGTDAVTLGAGATLAIADALHTHAADAVALGQVHVMVVADAIHAQLVSAVALSLPGAVLAGERCLVIPTETRALVVLAESRALAIAAEIRVLTIH